MTKKKQRIEKIIVLLSVFGVLALFTYFLWDILVPVLQMNFRNDTEGAKDTEAPVFRKVHILRPAALQAAADLPF